MKWSASVSSARRSPLEGIPLVGPTGLVADREGVMSAYQNARLSAGLLLAGSLGIGTGFIGGRLSAQPTAEITWDGESAVVTIRGTEAGKNYQILSKTDLVGAPWVIEQDVAGAEGQVWTQTTVPMEGRPALYMVAGYGEDSDGDGLSDVYEVLVTRTSPDSSDTGNTGISDTYKDPDGDEWTNLHEYRLRTDPLKFDPPRAPTNVRATMDQGATTATLRWDPLDGAVLEYIVEREIAPWSGEYEEIGRVAGNQAAFVDNQANAYKRYRVAARYPPGNSSFSQNVRVNQADVRLAPAAAAIVRGPRGQLYLAVSALPQAVASLRVSRTVARAWYPLFDYDPSFAQRSYFPENRVFPNDTSSATLEIPVSELSNGVYPIPASFTPDFGRYRFSLEVITPDGTAGEALSLASSQGAFNLFEQNKIPFLDGAAHLKQNLMFWLKAANASETFRYSIDAFGPEDPSSSYYNSVGDANYVSIDFYRREGQWNRPFPDNELVIDEFRPFQENQFLRNWAFQPGHLDGHNNINTGVGYDWMVGRYSWCSRDSIFNERYVFPVYDYVTSGNQSLLQPALSAAETQWIYHEDSACPQTREDPRVGVSRLDGNLELAPGLRNVFGLVYVSLKVGSAHQPYPVSTILHGRQYSDDGLTYFGSTFQEVENPVLQTESHYFAGSGDPMPGDASWDVNNQTPLLIAPAGQLFTVAGWAKQRIANGYTNKVAYLGQYFDKAFKVDPVTGQRTTQETGLLSEYGEFFPTEPGRVILTTKPDPDQGNRQGECLIHVIKLELDMNHDGEIDRSFAGPDNTSYDRPFRFWINNDSDGYSGADQNAASLYDSSDNLISPWPAHYTRDLEDFSRLWVSGIPPLPKNEISSVRLRWRYGSGPAIRIFQAREADGGSKYLTDSAVAEEQVDLVNNANVFSGFGAGLGVVSAGSPFQFPADFFQNYGRKHFLFEGVSPGKDELVLTIERNGQAIAETSVWMELLDIKDMYERAHIFNVTDDSPNTLVSFQRFDKVLPLDTTESRYVIIFVHGWNMGQWDYESFSETMYKRLWWQGYRGRFVAVRWPTRSRDTDGFIGRFFTYNKSEFRAFQSGRGVSAVLTKLRQRFPDYSINVCAHSMGNIVMAQALKQQVEGGFKDIDTYVLMQAATPAHCYDPALPDYDVFMTVERRTPTPDTYRGYPGSIDKTVRNRIVNFFNENDFALATGVILGKRVHWEGNEIDFKPDSGFGYDYIDSVPRKHELFDIWQVTDPREIMALVARPRSKAVGALRGVGGVIDRAGEVDLTQRFNFRGAMDEHSAQFNWNVHRTRDFYGQLLSTMAIATQP